MERERLPDARAPDRLLEARPPEARFVPPLDVDDAKHYLVLVADTGNETVRLNEIQVFQ